MKSMEINLPLISPLSRKYYLYAGDTEQKAHHRAVDIRICLEYVCDEIVIEFVSPEVKNKWARYKLHDKIYATNAFMDSALVEKLLQAKVIGNKGAHKGEEGEYTAHDIDDALDIIKQFSLEIFHVYFIKNGFGDLVNGSWVPTVFSTLPPIYRVTILSKYYLCNPSLFVIDKLAKVYLKSGMKKEGIDFLEDCLKKNEINDEQCIILKHDLDLLGQSFNKLNVADNLERAKDNFNCLLPAIEEDKRDVFVCLISLILNGRS
jgi:hypothetical protein